MKKIVLIVAMLYAMSFCGGVAYADNTAAYTGGSVNTATITDADDYSTVIITDSSDNIVYVDQADSSFNASTDFLLKANPSYGKYNVKLGGENVETANTYFYVGVDAPKSGDVTMKRLQNEETSDNIINIFQPDMFVIGGGISKEGDELLIPIKEFVYKNDYNKYMPKTEIKIADLLNDAGIVGAAMAAVDKA